jgi:long-subunit acyl-CoA synthetase (AMP-forming)
MLTQKLSIKRHQVVKKYGPDIEALYSGESKVLVA